MLSILRCCSILLMTVKTVVLWHSSWQLATAIRKTGQGDVQCDISVSRSMALSTKACRSHENLRREKNSVWR
ncbi:hypothetical protein BDV23DRAFT_155386 [Aspergillus alliaceus]|uniref:Secreted protein n=1 Tax=Petromyces alliaceus TaxID=209559 RepID=A0A5N7C8Y6_PETAA|nr:hypothetical protein BDV23DRAFT_155386 [Aspergillus alliaceus]